MGFAWAGKYTNGWSSRKGIAMYNYYLCAPHPLREEKTQVFCYHGHNNPYDCIIGQSGIARVELEELIEDYRRFNSQGQSFKEYWGFGIDELRDKIILAETSRVEGDEFITKLAPIEKVMKNDIAALNAIMPLLHRETFVRSLDDILSDTASYEFSRQGDDSKPEESADIEEDEDASFGYTGQL
jgi:hypothetical protein